MPFTNINIIYIYAYTIQKNVLTALDFSPELCANEGGGQVVFALQSNLIDINFKYMDLERKIYNLPSFTLAW